MNKRQRRTVGAVVEVPVDSFLIHAQILPETDMVFFNSRGVESSDLDSVISCPILFRVHSHQDAILDGRWRKVGDAKLRDEFSVPAATFIQDDEDPELLEIYYGGKIRPAKRAECIGLERCAVWSVIHIESRIRDHYNSKPNLWFESMKLK